MTLTIQAGMPQVGTYPVLVHADMHAKPKQATRASPTASWPLTETHREFEHMLQAMFEPNVPSFVPGRA